MVETARDHAERVADALGPAVADDRDVVVIEPSDHAMFQREYERLLDAETYDLLASDTYEILEYISGLLENGASAEALRDGAGERVASGTSCLEQLAHLLDRPAAHPVELLVPGDGRGL
jgi:Fe-S oxidoreductase